MDWSKPELWAVIAFVAVLNYAIFLVFLKTMKQVSIHDIVAEKSAAADGVAETSSSRVIGFLGGMIMACFIWAVANVVVFLGLTKPQEVTGFISSIGGFLVSGAALFLPYAVNKLTDVAKPALQHADREKADREARMTAAKDASDKAITAASAQGQLTADKVKSIVSDAINTATGKG